MKTGLESLDTGASNITYSGNEGPKSPQQIAEADYMLLEEYQKYVFEMEEMGLEPMSLEEFRQQARAGMNKGGIAMQGGVKNYLGQQETVSDVPVKWQSGPDKPETELAYITKAEKDLLLKEDIHGSLKDGPNMGPGGLMSLDSFGDIGGGGSAGVDTKPGGGASGDDKTQFSGQTVAEMNMKNQREKEKAIEKRIKNEKAVLQIAERKQAKDLSKLLGRDIEERKNIADYGSADALERLKIRGVPKSNISYLNLINPLRNFSLKKNIDYFRGLKNINRNLYPETEEGYKQYMADRLAGKITASGNVHPNYYRTSDGTFMETGGGGGQQQITGIQSVAPTTAAATTAATTPAVTSPFAQKNEFPFKDYFVGDSPSAAQLAYGKAMGVDPRMYGLTAYAADGGRIGYAGGGIADLRQGYFLGKLVKKVTRGIKKVAKSPIGKLALMYGGAQLGSSLLGKYKAGTGLGGTLKNILFGKLARTPGPPNQMMTRQGGLLNFLKTPKGAFTGITALSSLPLIFGTGDDEREQYGAEGQYRGEGIDIEGIRRKIMGDAYTEYPYAPAFANGGIAGARTSALNELYNINDDDEEQKLSLGGSAGLPPVTQQTEGMYSQSFPDDETPMPTQPDQMPRPKPMMNPMMGRQMNPMMARGMNPMMSMQPRMMAQEGGLMDMGGMEKDYRNEGGFVPIGGQERADDVPARLSKNEFVFTADAVRNAGGGDIDKGAEIMENMMENLEAGGKVSEESQGLEGARAMFATQKRLGEVL